MAGRKHWRLQYPYQGLYWCIFSTGKKANLLIIQSFIWISPLAHQALGFVSLHENKLLAFVKTEDQLGDLVPGNGKLQHPAAPWDYSGATEMFSRNMSVPLPRAVSFALRTSANNTLTEQCARLHLCVLTWGAPSSAVLSRVNTSRDIWTLFWDAFPPSKSTALLQINDVNPVFSNYHLYIASNIAIVVVTFLIYSWADRIHPLMAYSCFTGNERADSKMAALPSSPQIVCGHIPSVVTVLRKPWLE